MKCHKIIPTTLTASRIFVTLLLCFLMPKVIQTPQNINLFFIVLILTSYIYLSDILDGWFARRLNCCCALGAKADITADLFYILSQITILTFKGVIHISLLILIVFEFSIFIITSNKCSKSTGIKKIWFDKVGRFTAIYYYTMPLLYFILNQFNGNFFQFIFKSIATLTCFLLTLVAIISRLRLYTGTKFKVS